MWWFSLASSPLYCLISSFRAISKSAARIHPDEVKPDDPVLRALNNQSKARLEKQIAAGEINQNDLESDGEVSNHWDSDDSIESDIPPPTKRARSRNYGDDDEVEDGQGQGDSSSEEDND